MLQRDIARDMLLLVGGGTSFIIADRYITSLTAGNVNGTPAEPGPGTRVAQNGTFLITSGQLKAAGASPGGALWVLTYESLQANGTLTADVTLDSGANTTGLVFRYVDNDNFWAVLMKGDGSAESIRLFDRTTGTFTSLGNGVSTLGAGTHAVKIVLNDSSIIVTVNGIQQFSVTNVARQAATIHGVRFGNTVHAIDNFFFDNLATIPIDLFVIAGQSNAEGRGSSASSPSVSAGTAYEWTAGDALVALADPVGGATTGSAWPAFANAYYGATGRVAVFLELATGGTAQAAAADDGSGNWDTTGTLRGALVTRVAAVQGLLAALGYDVAVRGILWSQGERDAQAIDGATIVKTDYKTALTTMLTYFRAQIDTNLPFFIFRTGRPYGADTSGFQDVRDAQDEVATADSLTTVVFTDAVNFPAAGKMASTNPAELHYNQTGYNDMGTTGGANVAAAL